MEFGALPNDHIVGELVVTDGDQFSQAGCKAVTRHRLHHRIVDGIEHHVRRDDARGFRRVEPGRGERHVHGPGELAIEAGGSGGVRDAQHQSGGERENVAARWAALVNAGPALVAGRW
jgi:hypothetical protein